ncbi:MAG: class I tRNA ligase family protein, partial [Nitrospinota bacterium]|nr:class I tRNA ligase family protein [Nitrospinota bacterium]
MTLHLFNTLSRKLETFEPLTPNRVGIYVCGVTVYDDVHLGHARAALSFEIIRRYLRFTGYEVTYVRNFTDVDDKIIARAQEEGTSSEEIAGRYIRAFSEDMGRLGVPTADVEPRATEHVPAMVEMIEGLIRKGFAYASAGDVSPGSGRRGSVAGSPRSSNVSTIPAAKLAAAVTHVVGRS